MWPCITFLTRLQSLSPLSALSRAGFQPGSSVTLLCWHRLCQTKHRLDLSLCFGRLPLPSLSLSPSNNSLWLLITFLPSLPLFLFLQNFVSFIILRPYLYLFFILSSHSTDSLPVLISLDCPQHLSPLLPKVSFSFDIVGLFAALMLLGEQLSTSLFIFGLIELIDSVIRNSSVSNSLCNVFCGEIN